jgi:hypothetical protein
LKSAGDTDHTVAAVKNSRSRKSWWTGIIQSITTPLGFYVLALLIVEGTLCIVLTASKLDKEKVWAGFLCMIGTFIGVVVIVTLFVWLNPKHLLYGKDEHSSPALDPSALQDAIGDTIVASGRPECLKNPPK